jgi:hypothetical protein
MTAPAVIMRKKVGFVVSEGGRDIERENEAERDFLRCGWDVSSLLLELDVD